MTSVSDTRLAASAPPVRITVLRLEERGFVPNNQRLPVLVYHGAFSPAADGLAELIETRFEQNGWPPQWRNGIYDFQHYHAQGHEILGLARGRAEIVVGGDGGRMIELRTGDALLLPAGTGHCRTDASSDLLVIGGYPPGHTGDIRREPATVELRRAIQRLSFPPSDPVFGPDGPLARHWSDTVDGVAS